MDFSSYVKGQLQQNFTLYKLVINDNSDIKSNLGNLQVGWLAEMTEILDLSDQRAMDAG